VLTHGGQISWDNYSCSVFTDKYFNQALSKMRHFVLRQHFLARSFEISCYLLFFHVCNTSVSVRLSSLACVSRRSKRNLIAGGKLQPRRYFIKTVWKSRSTNCCRVPCQSQSYSKSNWQPYRVFHISITLTLTSSNCDDLWQETIASINFCTYIQDTTTGLEKQATDMKRNMVLVLLVTSQDSCLDHQEIKCKSMPNLAFLCIPSHK